MDRHDHHLAGSLPEQFNRIAKLVSSSAPRKRCPNTDVVFTTSEMPSPSYRGDQKGEANNPARSRLLLCLPYVSWLLVLKVVVERMFFTARILSLLTAGPRAPARISWRQERPVRLPWTHCQWTNRPPGVNANESLDQGFACDSVPFNAVDSVS